MASHGEKVAAELALLDQTLDVLEETLRRASMELPEWMAVAGFLHNIYSGIESILKLSARGASVELPAQSASSHRDLLDATERAGIISSALRERLDEYRAFRHFFVHGYGVFLDPKQLRPLAESMGPLLADFRTEILRWGRQSPDRP